MASLWQSQTLGHALKGCQVASLTMSRERHDVPVTWFWERTLHLCGVFPSKPIVSLWGKYQKNPNWKPFYKTPDYASQNCQGFEKQEKIEKNGHCFSGTEKEKALVRKNGGIKKRPEFS